MLHGFGRKVPPAHNTNVYSKEENSFGDDLRRIYWDLIFMSPQVGSEHEAKLEPVRQYLFCHDKMDALIKDDSFTRLQPHALASLFGTHGQ